MALSTENYGYLIDPFLPFTDEHGNTVKDGFVRVFMAGTSTPATTYANFDGTPNEEIIQLDNSGRTATSVIADKSALYKVCVYDAFHSQESPIVTKDNLSVIFGGSGGGGGTYTADVPIRIFGSRITNNGNNLDVSGTWAWAEGDSTKSKSVASHSEGTQTEASDVAAHAEGDRAKASGVASHAEGGGTTASGALSHAEGNMTAASGTTSHAEGYKSAASSSSSHAEGIETEASQSAAHAEGLKTKATGSASHAEGEETIASGINSHAGGQFSQASGSNSFAHGVGLIAANGEAVFGKFNDHEAPDTRLFSVGGGTDDDNRKTVFKIDASGNTWVMIDGVLTQVTSAGGGTGTTIYGTLQNAIADAANLSVGEYFETNGFHTSGDGGAARYLVSDTGTANGMDIVSLAEGKLAVVQLKGSAYLEQIGYVVSSAKADIAPYVERLLAKGIQHIKFFQTGSFPTSCYCVRETIDLDKANFKNVGVTFEGANIGNTSGYCTAIDFIPSAGNTDKTMFLVRARTTSFKNLIMIHSNGVSDPSNRGDSSAVKFDRDGDSGYNTASYGCKLENLTIQGFKHAVYSYSNTLSYVWHVCVEKCTFAANDIHLDLGGLTYCVNAKNCLFNSPDDCSVRTESPWTLEFDTCNFGIDSRGDSIFRADEKVVPSAIVEERRGQVLFVNCNFELEYYNGTVVPASNRHLFINADDNALINFEMDNCVFIVTPLARENEYGNRLLSIGSGSSIILRNTIGPFDDVNYSGNEFYSKDYDKLVFDENRPPRKEIGSMRLIHTKGIDPLPFLDSAHLPCLVTDDNSYRFDSLTEVLENFDGIKDGATLINLDDGKLYMKVGDELVAISSAVSNKVRIQNELYDYVVIDNRKWITRNLTARTKSRNWSKYGYREYGEYYAYSDLSEITAMLPSGWRLPNSGDIVSIVGSGDSAQATSLQKIGQPDWLNATNSTGFSAVESSWWWKPNTSKHSTYGKYAFYWTSVTEGTDVKNIMIGPSSVASGGWTAGEAANMKVCIRVCADA